MSKVSRCATLLAVALCWLTVSCAGVVFFKPPGAAITASATTPGTTPPVAAADFGSGSGYFLVSVIAFAALGVSMFMLQGKAPETA